MAQEVIGQHQRHHRLADGHSTNPNTGIMTSGGAQIDLLAGSGDRSPRIENGAGRLHRETYDDVLAGGYSTDNAAGVIGQKLHRSVFRHSHFVGILLP